MRRHDVFDFLDAGGEVEPKQTCPHIHSSSHLSLTPDNLLYSIQAGQCGVCKSRMEPWVCLGCNAVHCSRYVNADAEAHFFASLTATSEKRSLHFERGEQSTGFVDSSTSHHEDLTNRKAEVGDVKAEVMENVESEMASEGHGLALSLSDLSVWCYICRSYVKHDRLLPLLVRAEALKFSTPEKVMLLEGAQTRFRTGIVFPQSLTEDIPGSKSTPIQELFDHLKSRSLLAKMIPFRDLDQARAWKGLQSVLVLESEHQASDSISDVTEARSNNSFTPTMQDRIHKAILEKDVLVVVRVGRKEVEEGFERLKSCLRLMLSSS